MDSIPEDPDEPENTPMDTAPEDPDEPEDTTHADRARYEESDGTLALAYATKLLQSTNHDQNPTSRPTTDAGPLYRGARRETAEYNKTENTERQLGQEALDRIVAASHGHTETCMQLAETIAKADPREAQKPLLKAVHVILHAVNADTALITRGMATCVQLLLTKPTKKTAKRARHGIQTMMDRHGTQAFAAYRLAIAPHNEPTASQRDKPDVIAAWNTQAATKISQLPFTDNQWIKMMSRRLDPAKATPDTPDDPDNGTAHWTMGHGPYKEKADTTAISWNANSFFKRYRAGDAARILEDDTIDTVHITELRKAIRADSHEMWELRRGLEALGFRHAYWNWCMDTPGIHGSALFTRKEIRHATFGMTDGTHDPEGRTITTHMRDHSVVWTYTPCSKMHEEGVDPKRDAYDNNFSEHYRAVRDHTGRPVFLAGDMNIAPLPTDSTIDQAEAPSIPSNKPFERANYFKLLLTHGLCNTGEEFAKARRTPLMKTWSKGHVRSKQHMAMRLDHVLAESDRICTDPEAQHNYPCITDFRTTRSTYGSDHNANTFTVTSKHRRAPQTPQASCSPPRDHDPDRENVCLKCDDSFTSNNKLHVHVKAYGHEMRQPTDTYITAPAHKCHKPRKYWRTGARTPACCAQPGRPDRTGSPT